MGKGLLAMAFCIALITHDIRGEEIFEPRQMDCPNGYEKIAEKCLKFYQSHTTWMNAQRTCENEGAYLANLITNDEFLDVIRHLNDNHGGQYWVSGAPVSGLWAWQNALDTEINPAFWGRNPTVSSDYCAYICSMTHKLWDGRCSTSKRFICEVQQVPGSPAVESEVKISKLRNF